MPDHPAPASHATPAGNSPTSHPTIRQRLLDAGLLADVTDDYASINQAEIITVDTPDGPINGLGYTCDFVTEDQLAAGQLRDALAARCNPNSFPALLHPDTPSHTQDQIVRWIHHGAARFLALATSPAVFDGQHLPALLATAADTIARNQEHAQNSDEWRYQRATMAELRTIAAAHGLTRLPRRKHDLIAVIRAAHTRRGLNRHAATLTGYADLLMLRDEGGAYGLVLQALHDAATAGTLIAGGLGRTTFGTGLTLLDARDLADATCQQIIDRHDWHEVQMRALEPVKAELRRRGYSWFFLGNPREVVAADGTRTVRYWLNGDKSRPGTDHRGGPQPCGWYSREELLAEQFVTDALRRVEARTRDTTPR